MTDSAIEHKDQSRNVTNHFYAIHTQILCLFGEHTSKGMEFITELSIVCMDMLHQLLVSFSVSDFYGLYY